VIRIALVSLLLSFFYLAMILGAIWGLTHVCHLTRDESVLVVVTVAFVFAVVRAAREIGRSP
jgi:hypothetical protein